MAATVPARERPAHERERRRADLIGPWAGVASARRSSRAPSPGEGHAATERCRAQAGIRPRFFRGARERRRIRPAADRRPPMELRQLRYFVAVAEELHFRRAAERLHVAQPAVSEQVRKLELDLGVQLFERTHRSVSLTDAGAAMLDEARRVLRQTEVARQAACGATERTAMRLRIGYLPDALPAVVPRALRRLAAALPAVEVDVDSAPAWRLADDVRRGRLDVAITSLPVPTNGLRSVSLGEQGAVVALPAMHPCARAPARPQSASGGSGRSGSCGSRSRRTPRSATRWSRCVTPRGSHRR